MEKNVQCHFYIIVSKHIDTFCLCYSHNPTPSHPKRFDGISIVRNGGNYGDVSVNWTISRNSSDRSPVSDDLSPEAGTLWLTAGQMSAVLPLNITADELPEEAEAFVLRLLPDTVQGGAEVDEPMEVSLAWLGYDWLGCYCC